MSIISLISALAGAAVFTAFFYFQAKKKGKGLRSISKKRLSLSLAVVGFMVVLGEFAGFTGLSPVLMAAGAVFIVLG